MVRSNATAAEGACLESSDGTQLPGRAMPRPGSVSGGGSLLSVSLLAKSHPRGTSDAASANHFVQHKPARQEFRLLRTTGQLRQLTTWLEFQMGSMPLPILGCPALPSVPATPTGQRYRSAGVPYLRGFGRFPHRSPTIFRLARLVSCVVSIVRGG